MYHPTRTEFADLARRGNLVPVYRELPADLETPVSVYLKLRGEHESFLLESVEGGEQLARYSFLAANPTRVLTLRGDQLTIRNLAHRHLVANRHRRELNSQLSQVSPVTTRALACGAGVCEGESDPSRAPGINASSRGILESDTTSSPPPRDDALQMRDHQRVERFSLDGRDPLDALRDFLAPYRAVSVPGLPRFFGGAVGFMAYDIVRHIERLPSTARDELDLPEAIFLLTDTLVAFDHVKHRMLVIANAHVDGDSDAAFDDAIARIDAVVARLSRPTPSAVSAPSRNGRRLESNVSVKRFAHMVERAQEYIAAGDIFQVVLSQRFTRETDADAFSIYRALRRLNPSPYMFFLDFGEMQFVGSSPEVLVRLEDGRAQLNPIAGTRPRGADEAADARLEAELFSDPKERAEHVMLVDLGRNDLGRVCEYGSVQVPDLMKVERYSHVMHLVSRVVGKLRPQYDAFDLLRATFPAGTVSGAPKVRAMQIIEELEGTRRGPYAGAVGYFGFPCAEAGRKNFSRASRGGNPGTVEREDALADQHVAGTKSHLNPFEHVLICDRGDSRGGNMDFCITIRTIVQRGSRVFIQAGAGIVADSEPLREHQECVNKARALAEAIRLAEG